MIDDFENLLVATMRDGVAELRPPEGIVARAARRHRRRVRLRRAASVSVLTGVSAAIAVGMIVTATELRPSGSSPRPEISAAAGVTGPSLAQSRLVAAITTTGQTSYRMTVLNTGALDDGSGGWTYADYIGVYDPAQHRGFGVRRLDDVNIKMRLIGDSYYEYESESGIWWQARGSLVDALGLDGGRRWGPTDGASADPQAIFRTVNGLGKITFIRSTGSGSDALDHYAFSYAIPGDDSVTAHTLKGTVQVHHRSNLIAKITQQTTVVGAHPEIADGVPLTFKTTISFSDYGIPVKVEAPAPAHARPSPDRPLR